MNLVADRHAHPRCCRLEPTSKAGSAQELATSKTAMLLIWGMGCPTCAMRVRNALLAMDGVLTVEIALDQGVALIRFDPDRVAAETLPDVLASVQEGHHRYAARVLDSL